jgi:hemerythrin-like metal-binding protein
MPYQKDILSVKRQSVLVIMLIVSTLIGAIVLGILTSTRFSEIERSWYKLSTEREVKVQLLTNITASLGYGGLIHNFKNWVLRGNQDHADKTAASLVALQADISKYQSFHLTAKEEVALSNLLLTINDYAGKVQKIERMHAQDAPVDEIDAIAKVDDKSALVALATLQNIANSEFLESQRRMLAAVAKGHQLIIIGFILVPIPIFAAVVSIFFVRRLLREIRNRAQAERSAENASKSKSDFLSSMSHELRTPMNAVLGFAQMMQFDPKNSLSPAQNEHVKSIIAGGNHLLELVNGILDLARIEADQTIFNVEEVSVNEVVSECVELTKPLADREGIQVNTPISRSKSMILHTDVIRFKQVLVNLLSNAMKYNKSGGSVTIDGYETERGFARLAVTDTGVGISAIDHHKVFQMFHRVGADSFIAREGTGIGLSVTQLLVEKMAGQIGFESEEGVGSTFWFELPLASNDEAVIWSEDLRVGVDAIDKDHQNLFLLTNKIVQGDVGDADFDSHIEELINYTRYHFRREEAIMAACGYSDIEGHKKHHRNLIAQVTELARKWYQNRDAAAARNLRIFLRVWWISHITGIDTTISQYTHDKESEIQSALIDI